MKKRDRLAKKRAAMEALDYRRFERRWSDDARWARQDAAEREFIGALEDLLERVDRAKKQDTALPAGNVVG